MSNLNQYLGKIVATKRYWNNSMYIYEDSAVVYDNGEFKSVYIGEDIWDYNDPEKTIAQTDIAIRESYKGYLRAIDRKNQANILKSLRLNQISIANATNINYFAIKELYKAYSGDKDILNPIISILLTKKFRSTFRESIANQLKNWLCNKESRRYDKPLSPKQLESICRY